MKKEVKKKSDNDFKGNQIHCLTSVGGIPQFLERYDVGVLNLYGFALGNRL